MKESSLSFRLATAHDVERIYSWLLDHAHRGVHGSFLCNWNLTRKTHENQQLLVAILQSEPIAYMWGDFGILEVREEFRNNGVGKQLVEFAMKRSLSDNRVAVSIECKPESSIPFWEKMGFEFHDKNEASYVFEKTYVMPVDASPINVEIMFYPEYVKWTPQASPIKSYSPPAVLENQSVIHLRHRVATFVDSAHYQGDAVVKICVDGEVLYFDKAKYAKASAIGVRYESGAFYLDNLNYQALHQTIL